MARRGAALEGLDDDHAAAAARAWVRERLVGLGAVGIGGLGLCRVARRAAGARGRCCRRGGRWRTGRSGGCGGSRAAGRG